MCNHFEGPTLGNATWEEQSLNMEGAHALKEDKGERAHNLKKKELQAKFQRGRPFKRMEAAYERSLM